MKKVTKIEPSLPTVQRKKRVAAYVRVSKEVDRLKHSLSSQISYYNDMIQRNPEWEFVRVYADEFISGTGTAKRTEFQRMISDCESGNIDIILTKSISRFARNTIDLLETVRHLKDLGVEVIFERENINSLSKDGELMLTILASYAQEEVRSISENIKWRMRKSMASGKPNAVTSFHIYGYRWEDDTLVIVPEEAAIVRRIFDEYQSGKSMYRIAQELKKDNIPTKEGGQWGCDRISRILKNITYTGNILHQKGYIVDPITKKRNANNGELPQYYVENTHEAIIPKSEFDYVQELIKTRSIQKPWQKHSPDVDFFRKKIICKICGEKYCHQIDSKKDYNYWRHKSYIKCLCNHGIINHNKLVAITAEIFGLNGFNETVFSDMIEELYVDESKILEYHLFDGRIIRKKYKSTSRNDKCTSANKANLSGIRQDISKVMVKSVFTSKIQCGVCQCNFCRDKQIGKRSSSGVYYYWRCQKHTEQCMAVGLRDDVLREIISGVMKTEQFDEALFLGNFDRIIVKGVDVLELHHKDGKIEEILYEHPLVNPNLRWAKKRKQAQSSFMKDYNKGSENNG